MRRLLLATSLLLGACGPKFAESVARPGGKTGDSEQLICNEETFSPRGTAGLRCRSRRQIEEDKRFAKDVNLDSHPRQTFN